MPLDLQTAIALTCVAGAAMILARRFHRRFFGQGTACGGCGSCSHASAAKPLVELSDLSSTRSS
jgi:hypothetical protein